MYDNAIREAKSKGESSKVRRYTRAMETIKTLQKKVSQNLYKQILAPYCPPSLPPQAQSGKRVNLDELPPPLSSRGEGGEPDLRGGGVVPQPTATGPPPPSQKEISDEDLMAWAGNGEP